MKCPNCGKEMAEGEKFCIECGTNLENFANQATSAVENAGQKIADDYDATVKAEGLANSIPSYQEMPPYQPAAPVPPIQQPVYTNPAPVQPQQPYVNTAAPAEPVKQKKQKEPKAPKQPKEKRDMAPAKPLSTWAFFWRTIVCGIPVVGLILLFVFAFAKNINANSKSFARSKLIFRLIFYIIIGACVALFFIFKDQINEFIESNIIPSIKNIDFIMDYAKKLTEVTE